MTKSTTMTTTAGAPIGDHQNSQTAGECGAILLQDYRLVEKLAHQNHERIPERAAHAKGWGAHGAIKVTQDISKYTRANIFSGVGNDDYVQPRALFKRFDDEQKQLLFSNIAGAMSGVPENIVNRQLVHFAKIDPAFAKGVKEALEKS